MKVITFNAKRVIKIANIFFKCAAAVTAISVILYFSSLLFKNSEYHIAALNEITDEKIIVIDAGHGGEDCGAIGVNGSYEKSLNLEIANTLGEMLSDEGYAVIYTRSEDKLLYTEEENIKGLRKIYDLKNRCKIANDYENSIFISIHMNSYSNPKYSGLQVYYSENNSDSMTLADSIQKSVREKTQTANERQIKPGRDMYVLKNINNPAVLIECGFLTNPEECEKLSQKEYQKELSFSIICGIINYKNNIA